MILSPSSINTFIEEPAIFVLNKLFKTYGGSNIYAVRGKVAEEVVNLSSDSSLVSYDYWLPHAIQKTLFDNVDITEADYKDFYDWGCKCSGIIRPNYGVISEQDYLKGDLFGMSVGGYIDYKVGEGINLEKNFYYLDLKTVSKLPSIVSRGKRKGQLPTSKKANVRQQVIYSLLTGKDTVLLFVDKEGNSLEYKVQQADIDEYLPEIEEAINKIKKLLTLSLEDVILEIQPGKMNSFFWDEILIKKAKEVWKIKEKEVF